MRIFTHKKKERYPSMRKKLILSLGSIAVLLTLSGVISIIEYRRMSNHMSDLIASNVNGINNSRKLYDSAQKYNNQMLSAVMRDNIAYMPHFDVDSFKLQVDGLVGAVVSEDLRPVLERVTLSFTEYMDTSNDFDSVFLADTIDNVRWFFDTLQPKYDKLCNDIAGLNSAIYSELRNNTTDFDAGFYRSIIPGVVSTCAGLVLIFLLLYYILIYYVNPIYKISQGIDNYRQMGKKYSYEFDGDDQLVNINNGLTDIIEENIELKVRLKSLKEERSLRSE